MTHFSTFLVTLSDGGGRVVGAEGAEAPLQGGPPRRAGQTGEWYKESLFPGKAQTKFRESKISIPVESL